MNVDLGDLLGVGTEFHFQGVTYTVRKPTLIEQAKFSQWLKDRAKAEASRGDVPDEAREGLYRAAIRDAAEGYFDVDSPGYITALWRPSGLVKILHIIFQRDNPAISEEQVQAMIEAGLKDTFVRIVAAEQSDPKVMAGVLAVLGFPPDYLSSSGNASSDSPTPPSNTTPSESVA